MGEIKSMLVCICIIRWFVCFLFCPMNGWCQELSESRADYFDGTLEIAGRVLESPL